MVPRRAVCGVLAYQDFRGEIIMGAGGRGHTESNRQNGKKELSKPPPFVKAKLECIRVYLWQRLAGGGMSLRANVQTVKELTWIYRDPDHKINSKTELRGNQGRECTAEQVIPPGHRIYPKAHLISKRFLRSGENGRTLTQPFFVRGR